MADSIYEPSSLDYAVDNHVIGQSQTSLFTSTGNLLTRGVPLVARSIFLSFKNAPADIANWFGGDREVETMQQSLANRDDDLLSYYEEHQQGVDAAALVLGSFIPGGAAVKALKLAEAARFGTNISRATGLLPGSIQARVLANAKAQIQEGGVYAALRGDTWKAIGAGIADQALTAAAWETATIATMHSNPVLEKDTFGDAVNHIFWGGITGAGFGLLWENITVRTALNRQLFQKDMADKLHEYVQQTGMGNMIPGDKIAAMVEALYEVPAAASRTQVVKSAEAYSHAKTKMRFILNDISSDEAAAGAFFDGLWKMKEEGLVPRIGDGGEMGMADYLTQLVGVERLGSSSHLTTSPENVFYLNIRPRKEASLTNWQTPVADPTAKLSRAYTYQEGKGAADLRLSFAGDPYSEPWVSMQNPSRFSMSPKDAWASGYDVWLDKDFIPHVNPGSAVIKEIPRPGELNKLTAAQRKLFEQTGKLPEGVRFTGAPLIFNTKTGALTDSAFPVVGDIAKLKLTEKGTLAPESEIKLLSEGKTLLVGDTPYNFSTGELPDALATSALDTNARAVWAHLRGVRKGDVIDASDMQMLEAMMQKESSATPLGRDALAKLGLKLRAADGTTSEFAPSLADLQQMVERLKREGAERLLTASQPRADEIARKLNIPSKWLEDGLPPVQTAEQMSIPLQSSLDVNHVRLVYDISQRHLAADGSIARGVVAMQQRIANAQATADAAFVNFFGTATAAELRMTQKATEANVLGAGARGLSAANPEYGTLAQQAQFVGKRVLDLIRERVDQRVVAMREGAIRGLLVHQDAGVEVAALNNAMRRTGEHYVLLPEDLHGDWQQFTGAPGLLAGERILVPKKSLVKDADGNTVWNPAYRPTDATQAEKFLSAEELKALGRPPADAAKTLGYYKLSPNAAAYVRNEIGVIGQRNTHMNNWYAAAGSARELPTDVYYVPPVDTRNYQFVAFVRQTPGMAFGTQATGAIIARTGEELAQKVKMIQDAHPEFQIVTKGHLKDYFKARGDYDYNMHLTDNAVDSTLRREGLLSDYMPNLRPETEMVAVSEWHKNMEARLVRNFTELGNSQLFEELRFLGDQFDKIGTSQYGYMNQKIAETMAANPYKQYIKQALGISNRDEYTMWTAAQDKLEAFASSAFIKARELFGNAQKGLIPLDRANDILRSYGLGNPYGAVVDALRNYQLSSTFPPVAHLEKFVRSANSILVASAIRLDAMQNLINVISTPILMSAELSSLSRKLTEVALPTNPNIKLPGTLRLISDAIGDLFSSSPAALEIKQFAEAHRFLHKDVGSYFDMIDSLTFRGTETGAQLASKIERATDAAARWIQSDNTEHVVRFVAMHAAYRLNKAAGLDGIELLANVNTFVNRVHGVSVAAQRPLAFQGAAGAAIGLFQTYQFNLMQQLFRYVGAGDYKALALLAGMQSTMFGLQGLPGFQVLNTHIIGNAANNPAHSDIYSSTVSLMDKKMGDYLLYGLASNWMGAGVYSRGDINPRSLTILPINPLDIPTVAAATRFYESMWQMTQRMADGGKFWDVFLQGVEHNGLSRPLAGMAQLAQGYTTTGKGSLVSALREQTPGVNTFGAALDFYSISNAMRLVGARPLDEAVIMDAMFRKTAYEAKDSARMAQLGAAVKASLAGGRELSEAQLAGFMQDYTAAGGHISNFSRHLISWSKGANVSVANDVYKKMQTPFLQNIQRVLGGAQLPDYTTMPSTALAPVE